MAVSPREALVLENPESYLIRVVRGQRDVTEAEVRDPGQALAALLVAKKENVRCLVYATRFLNEETHIACVDEDFLRSCM
jgi:hypothetical protein